MKLRNKVAIVLTTAALSGTSFVALADNPTQKGGSEQAKQQSNGAPEVRFGNPSRTIGSDADQAEYDRQDGGIAGVTVLGSRIFESKVSNGATRAAASSANLIKHTGSPMAITKIYAIYWGSTISAAYKTGVNNFLTALVSPSNNLNKITTQYMTNTAVANQLSFSNIVALVDTTNPPSAAPTTSSILAEASKVATNNNIVPDANSLFMVFTNNYPSRANYCAWHGAGTVNGKSLTVAYQPYLFGVAGCPALTSVGGYATSPDGVSSVANVASHEIYEAITDPFLNAWYDSVGAEIGDKCAWTHGVASLGGYYVQTEWSNKTSTCVATA